MDIERATYDFNGLGGGYVLKFISSTLVLIFSLAWEEIPFIIFSGIIIATIAGLLPIEEAADLVNIGTLAAFTLACSGVMVLRKSQPDLPRPFKVPFYPWTPLLGIILCIYLILHLPMITWLRFFTWLVIGLVIYFGYSRKKSKLNIS